MLDEVGREPIGTESGAESLIAGRSLHFINGEWPVELPVRTRGGGCTITLLN